LTPASQTGCKPYTTMSLIFRNATEEDVDSIYRIEQDGHARWNKSQFMEELKLKFSTVTVLEDADGIIGFAVLWNVAGELQLNNIGIRKDQRRRGLGTYLLTHAVSNAFPGAPDKMFLEVSVQNIPAIQFYVKNGFTEVGRRKNYYDNVDAILMQKELRP
jgi:[ribosomal protein S18]-alanine N-acetyltransferase